MQNKRIEYIDIAKGIGILIVLVDHIIGLYGKSGFPGEMGMNMFKLPLFFFISGMFFPTHLELKTYISKKYKKLLLPFSFFFLTSICIIPFLLSRTIGLNFISYYGVSLSHFFVCPFIEENSTNGPIWFVWCLILINIIYYPICIIAERIKVKYLRLLLSLAIGLVGIASAYHGLNIPGHIDSALTAVFFFGVGDFLYHHTNMFSMENIVTHKQCLMSLLTIFMICVLAYPVNYRTNVFHTYGYLLAFPFGLLGTISVIILSKSISGGVYLCVTAIRLAGRYSLLILCTHFQIMQIVAHLFDEVLNLYGWYAVSFNTFTTLLSCAVICIIAKRFIPRLVGL